MKRFLPWMVLLAWTMILAITIAGCGGEEPTGGPGGGTGDTTYAVDSLAIDTLYASEWVVPADPTYGVQVTAMVIETISGDPAPNAIVVFSASDGTIDPESTITDVEGRAITTFYPPDTTGTVTITANCMGAWRSISLDVVSYYIDTLYANPRQIDVYETTTVYAVLLSSTGDPVEGEVINFSARHSSITTEDTTDVNGIATATLTAGGVPVVDTVTAYYGDFQKTTLVYIGRTPEEDTVPSSIVTVSVNPYFIYVHESGLNETAELVFEVRNSYGYPIPVPVDVEFSIESGPGGGEFLSPEIAQTNESGQVTTYLNSGTRSGTVRIVATVSGTSIQTAPLFVAIHGGPPHRDHFTFWVEKVNIAKIIGREMTIGAYVFDKYGNPVPEGTTVWFWTSQGGIYPGSGNTDANGMVSNTFVVCDPLPPYPTSADTYAVLIAQTQDSAGDYIEDTALVYISDLVQVELIPDTFNIPDGGYETFTVRVYDSWYHPIEGKSQISVAASSGELFGTTETEVLDAIAGYTEFSFVLADDAAGDTIPADILEITITVSTPNTPMGEGEVEVSYFGTID